MSKISTLVKLLSLKGGGCGFPLRFEACLPSTRPRECKITPDTIISKYHPWKDESGGATQMATGGASKRTSGTLHHTEKRDLHDYKTIWDSTSDAFLGHSLIWKTEFVTSMNSTYEGFGISHASGALWAKIFWKISAPAGRNFYRSRCNWKPSCRLHRSPVT